MQDREYRGDQKRCRIVKKGTKQKGQNFISLLNKMRIHECRRELFKGVYDRSFKKTVSMYEHTIKRIWNGKYRTDIRISYASILTP